MRICVTGSFGVTSLVNRLIYNTFSLHHKPTYLTTKYNISNFEIVDVPHNQATSPLKCQLLIITCKSQQNIIHIARQWFGFHKHLVVAIYDNENEHATLCPEAHFVRVDNMSREGIDKLLQIIQTYKYETTS